VLCHGVILKCFEPRVFSSIDSNREVKSNSRNKRVPDKNHPIAKLISIISNFLKKKVLISIAHGTLLKYKTNSRESHKKRPNSDNYLVLKYK
jgi:hypothetical protein